MLVRKAQPEDLPGLADCAIEFYASSKFLEDFHIERFVETWTGWLAGSGVIFLLLDGEEILGTIGGLAYQEPYAYTKTCQELFMFIRKAARGGTGLLRLYRAFESWSLEMKCSQIRMAHLQDSMPAELEKFYLKLGYVKAETTFVKALQ